MDTGDRLGYYLAFGIISHAIDNKRTNLSRTTKIYVEDVKNLFSEVVKGLKSKLNLSEEADYFVENLNELVEANDGRGENASSEDVKYMILKF